MSDYADLNDYKAYVRVDDPSNDQLIQSALTAASRAIDDWCGRPEGFAPATTATAKTPRVFYSDLLTVPAISSLTDLAIVTDENDDGVYETTWSTTDYQPEPMDAFSDGRPIDAIRAVADRSFPTWLRHRYSVQVTARWGWPAIPAPVRQACLILTQDLYRMKDVVFGASTVTLTEFGPLRVPAAVGRNAASLLGPYRDVTKMIA